MKIKVPLKSCIQSYRNKILFFLTCSIFASLNLLAQTPTITSFSPTSATVGSLITITGTDLSDPTALTIGGVTALAISNDGTTLVAMVMPGATTGAVSITTSGGTANGASNLTIKKTKAPNTQQGSKLVGTGNTGPARQGFSSSISADGNTAIVGGYFDNTGRGGVWIYTRSSGVWSQQGSVLIGTAVGYGSQGYSVSISADGNTAIVGGNGDNSGIGAAWVYTRSSGVWSQQDKLVGTGSVGGYSQQGTSVSISADGNTAIVGGYGDDAGKGAAWVYTRSSGVWSQQDKLVGTGGQGTPYQGYSVSISADGNTAMVGGYQDNSSVGAVWVYTRNNNIWTQQGNKLVGTGIVGAFSQQGFSVSLSADGNTAVVGGDKDNDGVGAVWVYTRSGGMWSQQGNKLIGTGSIGNSAQGSSVSLSADGNVAMVGGNFDNEGPGAVWVYTRSSGVWSQKGNKLIGSGGLTARQGRSVSLSAEGNTAIVGGENDNTRQGAAWIYTFVASTNANLNGLTLSAGTLSPSFSGSETTYTASVTNASSSITLTPTADQSDATLQIQVNSGGFTSITSGTASSALALSVGDNTIDVKVTAEDGTTVKTYTLTVTRKTAQTITFSALTAATFGDADITLSASSTSSLTVAYASNNTAVATIVDGKIHIVGAGTAKITASQAGNATYDAASTVEQTLTVNKATATLTLSNLSLAYTGTAQSPTVTTDPSGLTGVSITYNGSTTTPANLGTYAVVASLTNSNYTATSATGSFVITSTNANLGALILSNGTLSPTFDATKIAYAVSLGSAPSSFTITPTLANTNATLEIQINGGGYNSATSGVASSDLTLAVGTNTINVKVTAQDGTTVKVYTVTLLIPKPDANGIIYVKTTATGLGNGDSWTNAIDNLQNAIDATNVQQVWVATGTYQPASGVSYKMKNGVAIYGGFAGSEIDLANRNWTNNLTTLQGNNASVIKNLNVDNTAILDGFTITGGNAAGSDGDFILDTETWISNPVPAGNGLGGGIFNDASSPSLNNLNIKGNTAKGGNSAEDFMSPTVVSPGTAQGGGIYNKSSSSPILTNVIIVGNVVISGTGSSFMGIPDGVAQGGGMYNSSSSNPILTNVSISGNKSTDGGAMYNIGSSNPKIRNSVIYGNTTGIVNSSSTPVISYSLVQGSGGSTTWATTTGTNGGNNIDADPLFNTSPLASTAPFTTGDYTLQSGSPAINAGSDSYFASSGQTPNISSITTDLAGKSRINGTVDMGAFEYEGTLPVAFVSFDAKLNNVGAVDLTWLTASEKNNSHFTVLKSTDGKTFFEVAKISGSGNSIQTNRYQTADLNPANGNNYYRLVQYDTDGEATVLATKVVSLNLENSNSVTVFPNPTQDVVNVVFASGVFETVKLIDLNGKGLISQQISDEQNRVSFNIQNLPASTYIIQLSGKNKSESKLLLKK